METPRSFKAGAEITIKVNHRLPENLGRQKIHVTIKAGAAKQRVDRKVVEAQGEGTLEVTFRLPQQVPGNSVRFAAFVGKNYANNLQHLQTKPISKE